MKHKWTLDELIDHWTLLPDEQTLVERYKTTPNKLGVVVGGWNVILLEKKAVGVTEPCRV